MSWFSMSRVIRMMWVVMLFGGLSGLSVPRAWSGPITFSSALPLGDGIGVLRGQAKFIRKTGDPTAADRELNVIAVPTVMAWGASARLALFGVLPYVDKRLDVTLPGGRVRRESSGLGDARVFARYTLHRVDRPGDTFRVAPIVGLKLPTGSHSERDSMGTLPRPLQPGSGSWDPFFGITATRQTLAWEADVTATYRINTGADSFAFGDEAKLEGSFQYRLFPRTLRSGVPGFLYGVAETNLVWSSKERAAGVDNPNSGGTILYLAPGVQYVTRRTVLEAAIQLPAMQNLNGTTLETDWVGTVGFRWNF